MADNLNARAFGAALFVGAPWGTPVPQLSKSGLQPHHFLVDFRKPSPMAVLGPQLGSRIFESAVQIIHSTHHQALSKWLSIQLEQRGHGRWVSGLTRAMCDKVGVPELICGVPRDWLQLCIAPNHHSEKESERRREGAVINGCGGGTERGGLRVSFL
jgi:hypothetical protein